MGIKLSKNQLPTANCLSKNACNNTNNSPQNEGTIGTRRPSIIQEEMIEPSKVTRFLKKNNHDNDLQLLLPRTHFNPIEFKLLKQYFASLCSDPEKLCLNVTQCKDLFFAQHLQDDQFMFTPETEFVLHALFKAVNTDADGLISFSEFALAMSTAVHGNFYEKAKLSFRIYDMDGDGIVRIQDMKNYISTLQSLGILRLGSPASRFKTRGEEEMEQLDVMNKQRDMSIMHDDSPRGATPTHQNTSAESELIVLDPQSSNIIQNIPPPVLQEPPSPFPRGMVKVTTVFNATPATPQHNDSREGTSSSTVMRSPYPTDEPYSPQLYYSPTPHPIGRDFINRFFPDEASNLNADGEGDKARLEMSSEMKSEIEPNTSHPSNQGTSQQQPEPSPPPPTEQDIAQMLRDLFSDKTELNFQDYLLRAASEKYLVEGLGIYEHIFHPLYKPIQEFLSSSRPYEKSGLLKYKNRVYHVEIRGGIMYRYDEQKKVCKKMTNIEKLSKVRYEKKTVFAVKKGRKWSKYECVQEDSVQNWVFCLLLFMISRRDNRFDSFAPVRRHSAVQHLVDGKETFAAMAHAMLNAKEQIFIAGWCVSPYIYMKRERDLKNPNQYRLDNILSRMASKGVQIYIILWHETTIAGMNLSAAKIQKILVGLHPNIRCIMHPRGVPYQWTHHQKCVIVDQVVAFCGGLDLAWGRYDTSSHLISDNCHYMMTWPGTDYYNGSVSGFVKINLKIDSFRDGIDRDRFPRMPWHDVHCVAIGKLAKDFASNFVSRWNHHRGLSVNSAADSDEFINYSSVLELSPFNPEKASKAHLYLPSYLNLHHVRGQVIRSISTWSGSMRTEQSIHTAYIETIKRSQYYIYIENQYFCSHTPKSLEIENLVAQALIERISRAILNEEVFRVYVVLPIHPDGDPFDSSIQQVIKWERRTIEGIYETLRANFPQANIDNYIAFFSLCNYGFIQNIAHYNQVYIHSKLLLVDDKTTIIGSANINDRSMVGSHDSEIALIIEDFDSSQTVMNNKLRRVGKFGKSLRKRLWREHLGLDATSVGHSHDGPESNELPSQSNTNSATRGSVPSSRVTSAVHFSYETGSIAQRFQQQKKNFMNQPTSIAIKDPISDYTFNNVWRKRARDNTKIYESVFDHYPSIKHPTMNDWKRSVEAFNEQAESMPYSERCDRYTITKKQLSAIKGLLVEHPMEWLSREQYKKDIKLQVLDDNIFY